MLGSPDDRPEQEVSIRERGSELFRKHVVAPTGPVKSFDEYLKETPAVPIPGGVKAALWVASIIVGLLLAAAMWKLQHRKATPAARKKSSTRKAAATIDRPPSPLVLVSPHKGVASRTHSPAQESS